MQAALDAGLDAISVVEEVTFAQYTRIALAPDASVFWVASPTTLTVGGSLHYATDRMQEEDETLAQNTVVFTAKTEVSQFNAVAPGTMWIGQWPVGDGLTIQVAFAQRGWFYDEAQLWHYVGIAVKPAMSSQIISSAADLPTGPIVSNSLPIWLALDSMGPVYPSFLVPDNIVPPYIVAHIEPSGTSALQAFPIQVNTLIPIPNSGPVALYEFSSSQLVRDEVDLTLYGFTNLQAIQYLAMLANESINAASFGFANSPAIQDAKRTQPEIAALAQKKLIHVSANYYQTAANAIAYRLIVKALLSSITASTTGVS